MILDSDLIHNSRIREGWKRGDPFVSGLFKKGLLKIAMRRESDGTVDIARTAWSLRAPGTGIEEISQQYYSDASDLQSITSNEMNVGCYYDVEDAKLRYRAGVTDIFHRLAHSKEILRGGLRTDVARAIYQYLIAIPEESTVSWSTFLPESDLTKHLAGLGFQAFLVRHSNLIFRSARGPYVTTIPDLLRSPAIYSAEDQFPIDLFRGRTKLDVKKQAILEIPRDDFSLADHVRGLNALSVEDIEQLINSRERQDLDRDLARASAGELSLDSAAEHLAEYLRSVDSKIAAPLSRPEKTMFQLDLSSGFFGSAETQQTVGETLMIGVKALSNHYVPDSSNFISTCSTQFKPVWANKLKPWLQDLGLTLGSDTIPEPPTEAEQLQEYARTRTRLLRRFRGEDTLNEDFVQICQPNNGAALRLTRGLYNNRATESFTNPYRQ